MARSSSRMTSPAASTPIEPAKRRGHELSDQALLVAIETWRHRPEGRGNTARSGLGCGSVATSGLPASGCSAHARTTLSPGLIAAAAVAAIPMGEIITGPEPVWFTDRGVHGERAVRWIFTASRALESEFVGGMSARNRGDRTPPCSRSPWGCRADGSTAAGERLGGWPCGWITAHSIVGPRPTRCSSSASSRPTPSSPSPRPTASPSRFNRTLKEQIIHGRIYRNIAEPGRRPRLRRTLKPSGSSKRTAT